MLVVYSVQLVSLRVAEVEQLCQVKRMIGGIVNKTREDEREERKREREKERKRESKRERKKKKKREKETGERERPPVCAFNTSPCVRSKCPRVYRQHAHMKKTCGHVAGTHGDRVCIQHGDVLNAHTEVFSVPHHNKHHTTPNTHTPTHTPNTHTPTRTHNTDHPTRERERERGEKTEDRREQKRRRQKTEDRRRREKRTEEKKTEDVFSGKANDQMESATCCSLNLFSN